MCLLCVLRVRKLNVERLRELCCAWEQLSSFSVDARCLFYHRGCFAKSKMLGCGQLWLTRPAVKASAEATSHRFETSKAASAPQNPTPMLTGLARRSWA